MEPLDELKSKRPQSASTSPRTRSSRDSSTPRSVDTEILDKLSARIADLENQDRLDAEDRALLKDLLLEWRDKKTAAKAAAEQPPPPLAAAEKSEARKTWHPWLV